MDALRKMESLDHTAEEHLEQDFIDQVLRVQVLELKGIMIVKYKNKIIFKNVIECFENIKRDSLRHQQRNISNRNYDFLVYEREEETERDRVTERDRETERQSDGER